MIRFQISIPPDQAGGSFADFVRAWHTHDAFILDFSAYTDPGSRDGETDDIVRPATVVSRVRIPPSQVYELMKVLNQQLSMWEAENKKQPGDPNEF